MDKSRLPEKINIIKEKGNSAIFEIKPLFPGYGVTIGNSLRRVLLSSLPGAAITSVKVKGTDHEFSSIDGVKEDVVNILLNIKKIRLRVHKDEKIRLTLKTSTVGEAKAKDIKCPSSVEILNGDLVICNLTDKKIKLEMEFVVEKGRGYVPVEQREDREKEIGMMAIDAIYTPINRVSYEVEDMRVGKMTNYNRLTLEIETDGAISPREALEEAASILVDHFNPMVGELKEKLTERVLEKKEEKIEEKSGKPSEILIIDLELPERIVNALMDSGVKKASQLSKFDEEGLKSIPRLGEKAVSEIKKALKKFDISLKEQKESKE